MLRVPSNHVRIGDTARFPLGRLFADEPAYRRRWAIVAFTRHLEPIVARLNDGLTKTVSISAWDRYADDPRVTIADDESEARRDARASGLARVRAGILAALAWVHPLDVSGPGFYVSARRGEDWAPLLGPFVDHYSALQVVEFARRFSAPFDPYHDIGYGTCQTSPCRRSGRFNADLDRQLDAYRAKSRADRPPLNTDRRAVARAHYFATT